MNTKIFDYPPKRGFNEAEFEERVYKAQKIMFDHQLDAIFVTTPPNIRYFTGFDSQFWESPTRPWFIIIPINGKPIAVIPEIGEPEMSLTWIDKIFTWPSPRPDDDGVTLLKSTLEDLPKKFGRIGAELGQEMTIRMPVIDFIKLREIVSYEIINASPAIWEMRMIKTNAEVNHINHICKIVSDAFQNLPKIISPGDTEREVTRKLRIDILNRGADNIPFMPAISGKGGVSQIVCGPHDRILEDGDILFIDTGSTYDGYFCDFDRNFAIGNISSKVAKVHEILWNATEAGIKAANIGAKTDDIWIAINRTIQDAVGNSKNNVGRFGHGLGLQLTEPPSHILNDQTIIKENMVLTIEPAMEYESGKMIVHEENIFVSSDGAKLLTKRTPKEMPIIN
mgnify:CR=1 FL=1